MEGKKILIVDDEKNIRNVIKEYAKFDGPLRRRTVCRLWKCAALRTLTL